MKVAKSCRTLCNPMHYTVHGILQVRILEWVTFAFSRGIFPTQGSNPGLPRCKWILYQLSHKGSPRILEWVAYPFSRGIFPTQESNQGLLYCRRILYHMRYQGSPRNPIGSSLNSTSPRMNFFLFALAGLWTHPLLTPASQVAHIRNLVTPP